MKGRAKSVLLNLLFLVLCVCVGSATARVAEHRLTPPLQSKFAKIERELYAYVIAHGTIPKDASFMSTASRRAIEEHADQIRWDAQEQRLSYDYGKPYPLNTPFTASITAGLIVPKCPMIDSKSILSNATLYYAHGLLD